MGKKGLSSSIVTIMKVTKEVQEAIDKGEIRIKSVTVFGPEPAASEFRAHLIEEYHLKAFGSKLFWRVGNLENRRVKWNAFLKDEIPLPPLVEYDWNFDENISKKTDPDGGIDAALDSLTSAMRNLQVAKEALRRTKAKVDGEAPPENKTGNGSS